MIGFIVIEAHGGGEYAIICTDEYGSNIVFDNIEEAMDFAENECLDGRVVVV
jgi:hypothetical protein